MLCGVMRGAEEGTCLRNTIRVDWLRMLGLVSRLDVFVGVGSV